MKIIIVEDQDKIRNKITKISNQVLEKRNLELEIKSYNDYSQELEEEILTGDENIYILDIELPTKSGFDIVRQIRSEANYWRSIIMIASAYDQKSEFISLMLAVFTYISKFVDFSTKLSDSLDLALNILSPTKTIKIDNKSVLIDNILYIKKEKASKYSYIKTFDDEYRIRKSLSELQEEASLERIRKDLLINKKNTISINNDEIVFKNHITIN